MDRGPMRIGIVAHELPRDGMYGGVGRYVEEMVPSLLAAGVEVAAFSAGGSGATTLPIHVTYCSRDIQLPRDLYASPSAELQFERWLQEFQPHVVHLHHVLLMSHRLPELCRRAGIPYVLHVHDMTYFCNQTNLLQNLDVPAAACGTDAPPERCAGCMVRARVPAPVALPMATEWRSLGRRIVEGAHAVVYVSEALRRMHEQELGYKTRRSLVLLPSLRWPQLDRVAADASAQTRKTMRFGFLGNINGIKGLDLLLDAIDLLGESDAFELHVHGDLAPTEPYRTQIELRLRQPSRRIQLHGGYRVGDLAAVLSSLDWVVCSSRFEASPLVIHEAAACGVPAIGPRIGGVPEKIGEGGLLFEASDASSLADALRRALDWSVRDACAARVSTPPSASGQTAQLLELFQAAVDEHRTAPSAQGARVSVVLAVQNDAASTHRCIETLIEAGWNDDDELVIVDNGSTDGTPALLGSLEGSVKLVRNPASVSAARAMNQGATAASGRHLAFVRQETIVAPGWLDRLLHELEAGRCTAIGPRIVDEGGSEQLGPSRPLPLTLGDDGAATAALLPAVPALSAACMVVDRRAFVSAGGFDERFRNGAEDVDLCLRLFEAGGTVKRTDELVVTTGAPLGSLLPAGIDANVQLLCQRWSGADAAA